MKKVYKSISSSLKDVIFDGMSIAVGGFGLCGIPENLILGLKEFGVKDLKIISSNAGVDDFGIGIIIKNMQVDKLIASYVGENKELSKQFIKKRIKVEFCPMGTLAERIRAGGAGIPGFYTKTGVGTVLEKGKEFKFFDGQKYILEHGIKTDLSLIKAWKGDKEGNLVYRKTARNFNPNMATCGKICIAEVEKLVPNGKLKPDIIHTPGIFVDRIIECKSEKRIEFLKIKE
tara:strand:- start:59 stop:751 length:693 start_codon:yes stop_codon:yes gene_type:complete